MGEEPVDQLLRRVAAGDPSAFGRLHSLYHVGVLRVVMRVLQDQNQAQEVTQEVFLQLWQQAYRYDVTRGSTSA